MVSSSRRVRRCRCRARSPPRPHPRARSDRPAARAREGLVREIGMENLTRHAIFQNDHFFDLARRRTKALGGSAMLCGGNVIIDLEVSVGAPLVVVARLAVRTDSACPGSSRARLLWRSGVQIYGR